MKDYTDTLEEHRRLAVLTHLAGCAGYSSNAEILYDVVNGVGIDTGHNQITASLTWLREKGLIASEDHDGFLVVEATARGVDVALGRERHAGVRRPPPKGR